MKHEPVPFASDVIAAQERLKRQRETEWVLARGRSMSAGIRLVLFEIEEIGISVKNGWISPEQGASDLAALEQVPCHVALVLYLQPRAEDGEAAA